MFFRKALVVVTGLAVLAACGQVPRIEVRLGAGDDQPGRFTAFAVGDEPQAVRIAERMLAVHGTAADAATALALGLAVTLPSVAGFGGGGACLIHQPNAPTVRVLRMSRLAPGLRVLQSTYGRLRWSQLVTPAENLARFGQPVSQALAAHLRDSGPLMNDAAALASFMNARRQILQAGETLTQPMLADSLAAVRTRTDASRDIPEWRDAPFVDRDAARTFSVDPAGKQPAAAATSFIVGDDAGGVVACVLALGPLFGTGRLQEGSLQGDAEAIRDAALDAQVTVASGRLRSAHATGAFKNTMDCAARNELGTVACKAATDPRGAGLAVLLSEDRE